MFRSAEARSTNLRFPDSVGVALGAEEVVLTSRSCSSFCCCVCICGRCCGSSSVSVSAGSPLTAFNVFARIIIIIIYYASTEWVFQQSVHWFRHIAQVTHAQVHIHHVHYALAIQSFSHVYCLTMVCTLYNTSSCSDTSSCVGLSSWSVVL